MGSDSDVKMQDGESSDETEGSSGVESSEMETDEENDDQGYNDENVSSTKAKPSSADTAELKYSRAILSEYVEELRPGISENTRRRRFNGRRNCKFSLM